MHGASTLIIRVEKQAEHAKCPTWLDWDVMKQPDTSGFCTSETVAAAGSSGKTNLPKLARPCLSSKRQTCMYINDNGERKKISYYINLQVGGHTCGCGPKRRES